MSLVKELLGYFYIFVILLFPFDIMFLFYRVSRSSPEVFWKYAANLKENTHVEVWFE